MLGSLNPQKCSRKSLSSDQDEDPRAVAAMDIGRVPGSRAGDRSWGGAFSLGAPVYETALCIIPRDLPSSSPQAPTPPPSVPWSC